MQNGSVASLLVRFESDLGLTHNHHHRRHICSYFCIIFRNTSLDKTKILVPASPATPWLVTSQLPWKDHMVSIFIMVVIIMVMVMVIMVMVIMVRINVIMIIVIMTSMRVMKLLAT